MVEVKIRLQSRATEKCYEQIFEEMKESEEKSQDALLLVQKKYGLWRYYNERDEEEGCKDLEAREGRGERRTHRTLSLESGRSSAVDDVEEMSLGSPRKRQGVLELMGESVGNATRGRGEDAWRLEPEGGEHFCQEIVRVKKVSREALTTCDASSRQRESKEALRCLTYARTATVSLWKTTFGVSLGGSKNMQIGGARSVEKKTTGSNQTGFWWCRQAKVSNQAKVFKAHAVPQGLCGNLVNALKLLANQQEDGDGLIQNIVTSLCEGSRKGLTDGLREIKKMTIIVPWR